MIKTKLIQLLIICVITSFAPVWANETEKNSRDISRIEKYLNGITTLKSRFIQMTDNGERLDGTIFLNRPGLMRVQYDAPSPIFMVADGSFIIYVDTELEQISHIPISETPLRALISKNVDLKKWYKIDHIKRGPGTLTIALRIKKSENSDVVRLRFSDKPLQLRQWFITDATGVTVRISLLDVERDLDLDPRFFTVDADMFDKAERGQ
ncbi:MAG: hypothetical protein CMM58_06060 [Rhodospirillaceae bacterium]|nr:hypothetical protein [Rhodospirillaceae bacterium]